MLIATHNGSFHADEVFAIAAMKLLPEPVEVLRTRDREALAEADIRIDVGFNHDPSSGDFDHHQRDFDLVRENGIGYGEPRLKRRRFYLPALVKSAGRRSGLLTPCELMRWLMAAIPELRTGDQRDRDAQPPRLCGGGSEVGRRQSPRLTFTAGRSVNPATTISLCATSVPVRRPLRPPKARGGVETRICRLSRARNYGYGQISEEHPADRFKPQPSRAPTESEIGFRAVTILNQGS